ncbi:peptidylprolyl isomerase [Intestinimonas butyriciproducens]|uniref:peptidylprolyl isomerase n=1 Tax=Intestinimonas butyriciproducens TaxID=1297617 RepID=UPI00195AA11F|nr:peptidylprolyl isomerase [Intestinimonas butyriciproducens]MBM6974580.1 peptidylprolyl isomerase [Intestinimonas butyriciproducens]
MKFTTRILGATVAAAVLSGALAGCNSTLGAPADLPLPSEVPEDIIMQTAGIARDTPLITVDGAEVPAEEVLYWVSNYADQYAAWGMTDLSMDMGDGQTLGQYYLDSAVETAALYQLMQNKADELKLGWDKENQAAYDEQLQTMKESMAQQAGLDIQTQGDQVDTELVRLISYMGLSQEGFFRINQASFLYNNLMEGLFGAEGTDAPDTGKLDEAGVYHAKHILIKAEPTTDADGNVTDDGMAAAQAQAQEIYDQLLAAEDPMTLFDQLMTEYTDDVDSSGNVNGGTDGYTFGPGEMVDEFYEGTKALGEGEISQPVQSQYGYHIILRLSADNEAGYDKYAQIKMQDQIDQWMDEVQVERSETLESLDLQAFYDELNTLRSDISAASQADSAPAETTTPTETVAPSQSTAPAESEVPSETGTSAETPAA